LPAVYRTAIEKELNVSGHILSGGVDGTCRTKQDIPVRIGRLAVGVRFKIVASSTFGSARLFGGKLIGGAFDGHDHGYV
jgi:hypothetical protein